MSEDVPSPSSAPSSHTSPLSGNTVVEQGARPGHAHHDAAENVSSLPDSPLAVPVKVAFLRCTEPGRCPYTRDDGGHDLVRATAGSAGLDLKACLDQLKDRRLTLAPGARFPTPTGVAIEIDAPGLAGFLFARSGLGAKKGVTVSQGVGVIDPDYRGEIIVSLLNTSAEPRVIEHGERVAQLLILPFYAAQVVRVDSLSETARGGGGFGHTGRKEHRRTDANVNADMESTASADEATTPSPHAPHEDAS